MYIYIYTYSSPHSAPKRVCAGILLSGSGQLSPTRNIKLINQDPEQGYNFGYNQRSRVWGLGLRVVITRGILGT